MSAIYTVPKEYHKKTREYLREIVRTLTANNSLEKQDKAALLLFGDAFNNYILAREKLYAEGMFFEDKAAPTLPGMEPKGVQKLKNVRPNPILKLVSEYHNTVTRYLIEFNLTPKSRKKPEPIVDTTDDAQIVKSPIDLFISKTGSD